MSPTTDTTWGSGSTPRTPIPNASTPNSSAPWPTWASTRQPPSAPPGGPSARERAFRRALAAARDFRTREGHLNVPQRHIEVLNGDLVRFGQWINNARRRRDRLTADRIAELDALGMQWAS